MSDTDPARPKSEPANPNSTEPQIEGGAGFDPQPISDTPKPGDTILNPAQPYAATVIPDAPTAESFLRNRPASMPGYPKMKWHPVHGGVTVDNPTDEATLGSDWRNSPEEADASRTATEAWIAQAHNTRAKIQELDEQGHPIVRNSAQADEAIRAGKAEPL
jgi:hypothetical protein